ncbi:MAG: hypothetical protein R3251_00840 [Candidatus Spechtbacterales bacterium]|nr:hypothetical protein [Candidatus Spechtbacterales bacterium]
MGIDILYKKWFLIPVVFFIVFVFLLYTADMFLKSTLPKFYEAPEFFCQSKFAAITLPPVGIFLCEDNFNNELIRTHELVHWQQYQRTSSFGFYARYIWGWVKVGFDYEDNPMEVEAREKATN